MGQAKRRGTYEERKAAAIILLESTKQPEARRDPKRLSAKAEVIAAALGLGLSVVVVDE